MNNAYNAMTGVMFLAGVGIPVMAALSSALGERLGPAPAAVSLFAVALTCALAAMLASRMPDWGTIAGSPFYLFTGGVFVAFYVLSITMLAPRIGVATAILFVLLGQLVMAATIDHFGWLGAVKVPMSGVRLCGLALVALGVLLARKPV